MCGIIGIIGDNDIGTQLLSGIKSLEYRGYDSVGFATYNGKIKVKKDKGSVDEVNAKMHLSKMPGSAGIAHSRWATCGKVNAVNAHPHISCDGKIAIVHNGIISNYDIMRSDLESKGHRFLSETDSEVIAHYFEDRLKSMGMHDACKLFFEEIKGEFATLILKENEIFALRRDSPLVLGLADDSNVLASDIFAFIDRTKSVIFFDNEEYAKITKDSHEFYTKDGKPITKIIRELDWEEDKATQENYDHFMIKEIMEQPSTAKRLLASLTTTQKESFLRLKELIRKAKKVTFTGAGTSYFASLLGVYYLHKCNIDAQTLIASEFGNFVGVDNNTLVIALSQSGETMDVIEALKIARSKGAKIASLVNVPYSTIERMSDASINIVAGQEIAVASTKSFVNQTLLLLAIAKDFGLSADLTKLPGQIEDVLSQKEKIWDLAKRLKETKDIYILGRGLSYPVSREFALKIKEISYIHAEGMMGGELKHGTIALIKEGTPVISLISNGDMIASTQEVKARGADVITITNRADGDIVIETENDGKFAILSTVAGQLLSYYLGYEKDLPIDKPRNLAKSVTVK